MKECYKCHIEKPLSDYDIDRRTPTGKKTRCKACIKIQRQKRMNIPEVRAKSNAYHNQWQKDNKDKPKANMKKWRAK